MTKNVPGANVVTRSSTRNAAAATNSDRIVGAAAKEKVAKGQRHPQTKASDAAVQATNQEIPSVSRDRAPRNKPDASKDSEKRALAPGDATNSAPRPRTEVESGAVPVSGAAKGAKTNPRGIEEGDSRLVASVGLGIDYNSPVPNQNLGADDQARSEDKAREHISETGASKSTKRSPQDAENDNSPPATGKRARKSNGSPLPTGGAGAPSKAPSEDPGDEPPLPELSRGRKFSDILLRAVITDRALRERQEQYSECCHQFRAAQDANYTHPRFRPRGWNVADEVNSRRRLRHDIETADLKMKYLTCQLDLRVDQLQNFPHVSREDDGLEFLADNEKFWWCFDQFQERLETKDNLDIEIERAKQELTHHNNVTERLYRRIFEFGNRPSIPGLVEANVFGDLDDLPATMRRLEQLENSKSILELEHPPKTLARRFLFSAEHVFVQSKALVHRDILCNWNHSEQRDLHSQADSPQQDDQPEQGNRSEQERL